MYFLLGFFTGWVLAAWLLVHKAASHVSTIFHAHMNEWHEVLGASLQSSETDKSEKIKYVMSELKAQLGG